MGLTEVTTFSRFCPAAKQQAAVNFRSRPPGVETGQDPDVLRPEKMKETAHGGGCSRWENYGTRGFVLRPENYGRAAHWGLTSARCSLIE